MTDAVKPTRKGMKISRTAIAHVQPRANPDGPNPFAAYVPGPGVIPSGATIAMDDATTAYQWSTLPYNGDSGQTYFLGYAVLAQMAQGPEYRMIVETIAREMTRKWVTLKTKSGDASKADKVKELEKAMEAFRVQDVFRRAAELDGYFGRAHIYIDTGATDDPVELEKPMPADKRKIGKGKLVRLSTVEPIWTYPKDYNAANPLRPDYYRPQSWYVMGSAVHRDRLLTLIGREVSDLLKPSYAFGGLSMTQLAKPYVENWIRTRQSVSDLLHSFSKDVLKTNLSSILQGGGADDLITRLDLYNRTRDNRGITAIDFETEEILNVAVPLGTLDKLQAQSQEQMASVAGIPLVVMLGITPSGLNASSDGEIEAFYARIASAQEHLFDTPLTKVLQILQLTTWGEIDPDIYHEWNPLWEEDDATLANIEKTKADTDVAYLDAGVLSAEEIRQKIASDAASPYRGLDLSAPPPEPDVLDDGDGALEDAPHIELDGEEGGALEAASDPQDDASSGV